VTWSLPEPPTITSDRRRSSEIWAEDFTDLIVDGQTFKLAILIDVYDQYKMGVSVGRRATAALVNETLQQALAENDGHGPEKFLLSDNGRQYISDEHGQKLDAAEIVQRFIPACTPQYNGWGECENKEFKNVFYNVFERRERGDADKEKNLLERVKAAVEETNRLLNEEVPRPSLDGVTPADVHNGRRLSKIEANRKYYEKERKKPTDSPWSRGYWDVLKAGLRLNEMTAKEVMTKLAFFLPKPLRRIANLNREGVG
jgi:transposase InsO family protein